MSTLKLNMGNDALADQAEKVVLHRVLKENALYDDVCAICQVGDFRTFTHQEIFRVIGQLRLAGKLADPAAIAEVVAANGKAADVPPAYLLELWGYWTSHDPMRYAAYIRDYGIARSLAAFAAKLSDDAKDSRDVEELLEGVERFLVGLAARRSGQAIVNSAEASADAWTLLQARIGRYERKEISGVSSGLTRFDEVTGGFQPGELIVVAARTSVGKTVFGLNVAGNASQAGVTTAFVALEQPRTELLTRAWSSLSQVDSWRIRRGGLHADEQERLRAAHDITAKWPLFILDDSGQSVAQIASVARRLKRKHNLGLLVIDYLGLIAPEDRRAPRHEQVSAITRQLKRLARELAVPVMLLCQLNREAEKEEPRLSHLRESGSIEQDADTVILLHRETDTSALKTQPEWCDVKVRIAKQRNGPTESIYVQMHRPTFRFIDKKEF